MQVPDPPPSTLRAPARLAQKPEFVSSWAEGGCTLAGAGSGYPEHLPLDPQPARLNSEIGSDNERERRAQTWFFQTCVLPISGPRMVKLFRSDACQIIRVSFEEMLPASLPWPVNDYIFHPVIKRFLMKPR